MGVFSMVLFDRSIEDSKYLSDRSTVRATLKWTLHYEGFLYDNRPICCMFNSPIQDSDNETISLNHKELPNTYHFQVSLKQDR